jgi:O-methyltransferase
MERKASFYARYYARLIQKAGFSVAKGLALPLVRPEAVRSGAHAMAYPISSYAPWQADEDFQRVFRAVKPNTLVDVWRCHELWSLLAELVEIAGDVIEVGVWRGGSGVLMASRLIDLGVDASVYLCDTWQGVVKTGARDIYYRDGKHGDTSKEVVERLVQRMGLGNIRLLEGIFPDDTADRVADRTFRLVHIDVDVYQSARDVLDWTWRRLSPGGVVVFDDYGFPATPGVTQLVDEQRRLDDRLVVHNLNGHGVVIKR